MISMKGLIFRGVLQYHGVLQNQLREGSPAEGRGNDQACCFMLHCEVGLKSSCSVSKFVEDEIDILSEKG